ncbi:YbhB/YbcL family Raf kinase inhibitor-like protein [Inquilinus limosus]|uniref:YbhB/YbcL family Raf kinase inhibitor-like protein n=1 Tax=Inquilinus limosus TaxID=171674 RepID=UPI003F167121
MRLWSEAFEDGQEIPVEFTRDGHNVSPPLRWSDLPDGTRELAILFEGVTPATREPWLHWLAYKIPAELDGLPAGFKHQHEPEEPLHLFHGRNSLDGDGYQGPQGTLGRTFRYRFRLLALDRPVEAPPGLDRKRFEKAIAGHVLDEAELHATYTRQA